MSISNNNAKPISFSRNLLGKSLIILGTLFCICVQAEETGSFKVTTGFDYSSGDYGNAIDTEIWYVPLTLKYKAFPWTAKVTIPWLEITGPGGVVGGGESLVIVDGGTVVRTTESGLGDIVAGLTYSLDPVTPASILLDFTGKIKFPTADEDKGLGTGEFDYTIQLDASKNIGRLTPLATLGYKFRGDPDGLDFNNSFFISLGAAYKINEQFSTGATLDFREAATDRSDDVVEFFAYFNWKLNRQWSLNTYGVAGFTDGSPDEEVGMQISFRP